MDSPNRKASVDVYHAGDLTIDVGRQTVNRAGLDIPLPRLSFEVLVALVEAHPRMLSIEELMESVWAPAVVNAETVSQRILLLRHSLGDHSASPRYIVGVRGRGYRFDAPVSKELLPTPRGVLHTTPEPAEADKLPIIPTASARPAQAEQFGLRRIRQQYPVPGAVLTLLGAMLVIIGSLLWFAPRLGHEQGLQTSVTTVPRVLSDTVSVLRTVPEHSIAVLPFVDMSEKHDQEYFADGLTEDLIDRLSHNSDLKVISRTSSFAFKGKNEDVRTIAIRLGVANVLEGSVRKSGHDLRITAQLIRASDGVHFWSDTYASKDTSIFKVQNHISMAVASALDVALTSPFAVAARIESPAEAYNLMLQGNYFRRRANKGDLERAIGFYKQSLTLDPHNALTWAQIARVYVWQGSLAELSSAEAKVKAQDALKRSLAITVKLATTHFVLGNMYRILDWNRDAAKLEYERALELDPYGEVAADARDDLAWISASRTGRVEGVIPLLIQDLDTDPLDTASEFNLGILLYAAGSLDGSAAAYRKLLLLNPDYAGARANYGLTLLSMGRYAEALAVTEKETDEKVRLSTLPCIEWAMGLRPESNAALRALEVTFASRYAYGVAVGHACRGESAAAMDWLEQSYRQHESALEFIKVDPLLRPLHGNLRFQVLLRKMRLPET